MSNSFQGKVVLVTGASAGIGQEIAIAFAEAGAKLVINGRDRTRLEQVRKTIEAAGGQAVIHVGDVRLEEAHKEMTQRAIDTYGALHIAVNNAGIYKFQSLPNMSGQDISAHIDINLKGVLFGMKYQLPAIGRFSSADNWGSVVNISTGATQRSAKYAKAGALVYATTKVAVDHASYLGASEGAPYHVRVNAIAVGPVFTPGVLAEVGTIDVLQDSFGEGTVLKRIGTGRDVADAIMFVSKSGSWITGGVFPVDGGLSVA